MVPYVRYRAAIRGLVTWLPDCHVWLCMGGCRCDCIDPLTREQTWFWGGTLGLSRYVLVAKAEVISGGIASVVRKWNHRASVCAQRICQTRSISLSPNTALRNAKFISITDIQQRQTRNPSSKTQRFREACSSKSRLQSMHNRTNQEQ